MTALTPKKNLLVKLRMKLKKPLASPRVAFGAFAIAKSGPERQQLFNVIDHDVLRIDWLAQIIVNLITNAISLCGAGDVIRSWVPHCDNWVLILVEDMGLGLSDGSLQKNI